MYFFTADLHFGNDEIIEREARPFRDIKEFEDVFVENVNRVAAKEDTLFVLGDWIDYSDFFKTAPEAAFAMCRRLLPKVVLILGNGEERLMNEVYLGDFDALKSALLEYGFSDVLTSADIEFGGEKFHLIHKPVDHIDGCTNLFGHTHRGTGLWKPYGLNVGIDLNYFRPFSEAEILRLLKMKREWWDKDPDIWDM